MIEIIVLILVIGIVGYGMEHTAKTGYKKQYEESRDPVFEKLGIKNEIIYSNNVEYLGGSPDITQNCKCYIDQLDNGDLVLYTWKFAKPIQYTVLEREYIQGIQLIDKTQVVNNPKLSSILIFGTAGLAIGNKDTDENYYINIQYNNTNIILGCKTRDVMNVDFKEKAIQIYSNLNRSVLNV